MRGENADDSLVIRIWSALAYSRKLVSTGYQCGRADEIGRD
jgi:hypothetical protein